ncbi:MAG: hypothetical protein EAZ48_03080 [Flavobacteriia bacterium]|jgi:hypothetical protein|nr:MAG: hypothetical protein EAZ48_03080 [Flavobacteriia bacterium]
MKIIYLLFILGLFTSCIEIWDDLTLNNDGSGTLRYKINLSESKVKVNSILALDSLDGKPVPSKAQISAKINEFVRILDAQVGISNVLVEENYTDFIFKFSCDFSSIRNLQDGIKLSIAQISNEKLTTSADQFWLSWDGNTLVRSIPSYVTQQIKNYKLEDAEQLKEGVYTSIARFERPVASFENKLGTLSKNQMAVMVRTNTFELKENQHLLDNTIVLTPR